MHTFYTENGCLTKDDAKHAFRVLRLTEGDEITALENNKRFKAVIKEISEKSARVDIIEELPSNEPDIKVTLYQGLPKAEKLEFLAQKLTELGVTALVPVRMERSVAKMDGEKRLERLERISKEAVKQCRRSLPLEIYPVTDWKKACSMMQNHDLMLVPWENAESVRLTDIYKAHPEAKDIGILVGCEGGISENEISDCPALPVSLGARILRAETAAITSCAVVMALYGEI